ncbi:hypothetical protein D3C86_1968880 [compost metagenome]
MLKFVGLRIHRPRLSLLVKLANETLPSGVIDQVNVLFSFLHQAINEIAFELSCKIITKKIAHAASTIEGITIRDINSSGSIT